MKTSQFFWNDKNQKCEIWNEEVNGKIDYWLKVNGISQSISEKKYNKEMGALYAILREKSRQHTW